MLIIQTEGAYLGNCQRETDTILVFPKENNFLKKNLFDVNLLSCDFEKSADSALLAQKELLSEKVRDRPKGTKFWYHQRKKTYLT